MLVMNNSEKIVNSDNAAKIFSNILNMRQEEDKHKEFSYTMGLDSSNIVLYIDLVTMGTVNSAAPAVREVIRQAIIKNAVSIIICHNHPSGDTKPSREDRLFTKQIREASKILEINLLDHIIIGKEGNFYSFEKSGTLLL